MSCRTSRPPASVLQLPICICESNRPSMIGTGTVSSGAICSWACNVVSAWARRSRFLDAQLRTDVEVLGEMSGAVLQSPPAADDHVVDAVLVQRVDRLQRLEHAAASSRRGRQPAFGADASLLAVDERPQFCRRRWPLHPHQDRAVISAACGRSALDATALLGGERRVAHEPQFTAGVVAIRASSRPYRCVERSSAARDGCHPLPRSGSDRHLRFRFVLAESESGSTATRPEWATKQNRRWAPFATFLALGFGRKERPPSRIVESILLRDCSLRCDGRRQRTHDDSGGRPGERRISESNPKRSPRCVRGGAASRDEPQRGTRRAGRESLRVADRRPT